MKGMLDRLLTIESLKNEKEFDQRIDFPSLLNSISEKFTLSGEFQKVNIKVHIDKVNDYHSNEKLLRTVLSNLIENSLKFRDPEKENNFVEVRVDDTGTQILIKVIDNGIGIPSQISPHIFEIFYKGNNEGAGIGLYISKTAISRLGGNISLSFSNPQLTAFEIVLPKEYSAELIRI
jgi:signal transduction histidine kinase